MLGLSVSLCFPKGLRRSLIQLSGSYSYSTPVDVEWAGCCDACREHVMVLDYWPGSKHYWPGSKLHAGLP